MLTRNLLILLILSGTILSCDETKETNECVDPVELEVEMPSFYVPMNIIFENDSIIVQVPQYFTPNGDAMNDYYSLEVEIKEPYSNNSYFNLISSGSFEIINNCDQLYYTTDKGAFFWWGEDLNGESCEDGKYYCRISIELFDGTKVDEEISLEIHR